MKSILDHPIISERYFFPRRAAFEPTKWVRSNGIKLSCFQSEHKNPLLLLHFHGNGEAVFDYLPKFPNLMDSIGADVFMAEYRGYGESDGVPQLGAMLDDVENILNATGRPDSEVIVLGRSIGSVYAIELAARHPDIAGLIIEGGIADPKQRLQLRTSAAELGVSEDDFETACSTYLDQAQKIRAFAGPLLIMHAINDNVVSIAHAEQNFEWSVSTNKTCVRFPWGDHVSNYFEHADYLKSVSTFFKSIQTQKKERSA